MRLALVLLAAVAVSSPAWAQGEEGEDDAIGDILMSGAAHPAESLGAAPPPVIIPEPAPPTPPAPTPAPPSPEDAVGRGASPPPAVALAAPPSRPAAPAWTPPPSPSALAGRPSQPASLHNPGPPPDGAPAPRDLVYEGRVRTTFASAQGAQGAMDGGWVLVTERSERLYALQIVDHGDGLGLEGAWRDLRRPRGALGVVGLIDSIGLDAGGLSIRFTPRPGAEPVSVSLLPTPDGGWVGEVTGLEHGRVSLRRP